MLLAILVATALGGGPPLIVQSASSAVLVATLTSTSTLPWTRFFDALVGGGIGLIVMTVLLPLNPLTVVRRAADPALTTPAAGTAARENVAFAPSRWRHRDALGRTWTGPTSSPTRYATCGC